MYFGANKTLIKVIRDIILDKFILVLMESRSKSYGKNFVSQKIMIRSIITQVIMMLALINMA